MSLVCSVCETINAPDVDFCEGCGVELLQVTVEPVNETVFEEVVYTTLLPAKLLVKNQGALTGNEYVLGAARLTLGRFDPISGPVDIDLSAQPGNETVSRLHAELFHENGIWYIKDLGSTNGVFLRRAQEHNFGPRLLAPAALADGDELSLGNAHLLLSLAGAS
jgi:pSer/pThr/pTyr-binding forkhead associated (FHA) protein